MHIELKEKRIATFVSLRDTIHEENVFELRKRGITYTLYQAALIVSISDIMFCAKQMGTIYNTKHFNIITLSS